MIGSGASQRRPAAALAGRLAVDDPALPAIAVPVIALAVLGWARRWAADDAYIDFRVVDNVLHGLGPVFNAGERVEAYTSPLWVALLALLHGILGFINLPWTAVVLGLALSVAGLAAGSLAALKLWRQQTGGRGRVALPVGAAIVAALPPVWDFATSGLETGLVFAWLGFTFLALVHTWLVPQGGRPRWTRPAAIAVLAGIGPLIRPDLGIFSLGFLVVLLVLAPTHKRYARARLVGWAITLPLAYQVFRMGYFAALVPNTAIAKEAGRADWSRGWAYLWDFVKPYGLYLPIAAAAVLVALQRWRGPSRAPFVLALAPVACGLVHTLYVVRVGGDFMHGRLLLPGLFGMLLPVMVVAPARWSRAALGLAALTVAWALVCAIGLRYHYPGYPGALRRFVDERAFYVASAHNGHPVSLEDYRRAGQVAGGLALRRRLAKRVGVLALNPHVRPLGRDPAYPNPSTRRSLPNRVAGAYFAVGLVSYTAGHRVTVVDRHGLADPIAARLEFRPQMGPHGRVWPVRYRAGHEKGLPLAWVVARYASLGSPAGRRLARSPSVAAATRALRCSKLRDVLRAVDSPLTLDRLVSNIGVAWRLRSFRLPPEPQRAERQLCG